MGECLDSVIQEKDKSCDAGTLMLLSAAWHTFEFFIYKTKPHTPSQVSSSGMMQYHSLSTLAVKEKQRKGEEQKRSQVLPVKESYIKEIIVMSRYFCCLKLLSCNSVEKKSIMKRAHKENLSHERIQRLMLSRAVIPYMPFYSWDCDEYTTFAFFSSSGVLVCSLCNK